MDHDPTEGRGAPAAQITPDMMIAEATHLTRQGKVGSARFLMVAAQRLKRLEAIVREETSDELGQLLRIGDELGIPRPPRHESPIREDDGPEPDDRAESYRRSGLREEDIP